MSDVGADRDGASLPPPRGRESVFDVSYSGLQLPELPEQPRVGQVVLRPLERGFGYTLGNTIRRILLSSLRGSAVWAFRAQGMRPEHTTIPGVLEDVHEISRNLKSLVLRMDEDADEAVLELRASKAGPVTARNITGHPSVDVINPEHHILELQDDRDLRFELYVNKGRGYVPAESHPIPRGMPADLVRVDAIYNPVTRANFVVEETRVGQRTDFDRLVLEVETNGAIDVPSAVQYSARLAIEHLAFLAGGTPEWRGDRSWGDTGGRGASVPAGRSPIPPRLQELLNRPIEDLAELSVRGRNSLQKENIHTVRDLVQRTEQQMLAIDNFGKKSLQEISDFLAGHGLRFGSSLEADEGGTLWWVVIDSDPEIATTPEDATNGSATVLTSTGNFRLPLEVRDMNLRLVARARAGEAIRIPFGRYLISALLPSGESVETFIDASNADLIEVDLRNDTPALHAGFLQPIAASGDQHTEFFFRAYVPDHFYFSDAGPRSPDIRVIGGGSGRLSVRVKARTSQSILGQIAVPGVVPLNFAIPVLGTGAATECELMISQNGEIISVGPKFESPQIDLALTYLHAGDVRGAGDVFTFADLAQVIAEQDHPVIAAIGSYLLLRLDRINPEEYWPITFSQRHSSFADALVIAGETTARAGDHTSASTYFIEAMEHGLPMFSEGFSLLYSRLRQYGRQSLEYNFPLHLKTRCAEMNRFLGQWAPFVRTDLQLLAFSGGRPWDPAGSQLGFEVTTARDAPTRIFP